MLITAKWLFSGGAKGLKQPDLAPKSHDENRSSADSAPQSVVMRYGLLLTVSSVGQFGGFNFIYFLITVTVTVLLGKLSVASTDGLPQQLQTEAILQM